MDRGSSIIIDQGLDTAQISTKSTIDPDLVETSYTVQIDNRFGSIIDKNGNQLELSYIDDDNIAYYIVSTTEGSLAPGNRLARAPDLGNTSTVSRPGRVVRNISNLTKANESPIAGPRGTRLEFKIKASLDLQTSSFLFQRLGGESALANRTGPVISPDNVKHIDSIVRVSGMNTGYSLDLPVRFVKLI